MRRRRLFVAAAVLLLAGSLVGAAITLNSSPPAHGSALNASPVNAQQPPLSNLATRMAFCGNRYTTCHSPDGKWSIVYVNRSPGPVSYTYSHGKVSGYEPPRVGCTLNVTHLATGQRTRIHLRVADCDRGVWLGNTYLVQDSSRLLSVDLPSRHVKLLARFVTYVVSPDERWIAGEAEPPHPAAFGGETPRMIAVLSLANHSCRVAAQAKTPDQGIAVDTSPWQFIPFPPARFKDPVVWRTVVQGGQRIRVVSGPGTGFTRDSGSLILAKWQDVMKPHFRATQKRLVKLNLSSLHTPCPASVAPR